MEILKKSSFYLIFLLMAGACQPASEGPATGEFSVNYESYSLDNGLHVIFHIDRSDPVVAVVLTSHVGSARELPGRTGFAHLFEHLLFLQSENLGKGGLDKLSARIGGSGANGSTSRDRTNYFQTVPNDALEKMIWAEADKLGFFINTVTEPVLQKEKQVVKNEKRQSVDNNPYGHTFYVVDKNLYPENHPYNWEVIGSLQDLDSATLQDVKDFYNQWYVPNNCTLVISGDFDTVQAKEWVEKYFGEIKRGAEIAPFEKRPVFLDETKKLYHEDNFARLPELTLAWPGVYQYHPDSYPLEVLVSYLSEGKKAPLNKILIDEKQLTSRVSMFNYNSELAGQLMLRVRGFENVNLNDINSAINEAFQKFEAEGISEKDLDRIKAGQETSFYNGLASVLGKGFQLAQYQIFAGDPGYINEDVKKILAVTSEDVMRVYNQYIKGKNFIVTSFVPKGQTELILEGSLKASVVEEQIIAGAETEFQVPDTLDFERTPSAFDRTIEPPYGKSPVITPPTVWENKMNSGINVLGIQNDEVPLIQFRMNIRGGLLLEDPAKAGVSNLLATLLTKGTQNKTTEELEDAIQQLGASIDVNAGDEEITISGSTLSRNYAATIELLNEILLQPRWDEAEFELAKQDVISRIKQQEANPNSLANNYFRILNYGREHILSHNILGSLESQKIISIEDLKNYYDANLSPALATFLIVGDIDQDQVIESLSVLDEKWPVKEVSVPEYDIPDPPAQSKVYFYDVPGAKQSVIRFGYLALAATDDDYYPAQIMNYILGGGGFASQLTQQLREGKGYTYGIGSSFSGTTMPGTFQISSGVRSNVTYESASLVKEILEKFGPDYNAQDLEVTKSYFTKSNARTFETMFAKLRMLENISAYGWPHDYAQKHQEIVRDITLDKIKALASKYIKPDKMNYLIVGDAATQLENLEKLGFGKPVLINDMAVDENN